MTPAASPSYADYGWRPSTARRCRWATGALCLCHRGTYRKMVIGPFPLRSTCRQGPRKPSWPPPRSYAGRGARRRQLLDHARRWRDADGQPIMSSEPYEVDGHDLADLVGELDALGLEVDLSGASPYYPGATILLTIRRSTRTPYVSATGAAP